MLKKEVKKVQKLQSENSPLSIIDKANDSSFFLRTIWKKWNYTFYETDVDQFLDSNDRRITLLDRFPAIRQIYKKYNRILTSSASSERLFSKGKLVFDTKRHSLTDNHFEQKLILNCNKEMTME